MTSESVLKLGHNGDFYLDLGQLLYPKGFGALFPQYAGTCRDLPCRPSWTMEDVLIPCFLRSVEVRCTFFLLLAEVLRAIKKMTPVRIPQTKRNDPNNVQ